MRGQTKNASQQATVDRLLAKGWLVDGTFASSPRQLAECLSQSEPCRRMAVAAGVFEDL